MRDRSPSDVPAASPPSSPSSPSSGEPWDDEQRETVVAVFGDTSRAGAWYPPDRLIAIAGFGNVKLDFRDADLPAGPTEIRPFAVFGNVEVIVPRHIDVELNGVSLFGSIKHTTDRTAGRKLIDRVLGKPPPAAAPLPEDDEDRWLVVQGWAVFGNVKVKVVDS
jgi:hypothetical protein